MGNAIRSRGWFVLLVALALAAGLAFAFASDASKRPDVETAAMKKKKKKGFSPNRIAGKWIGTWQNPWGSKGDLLANITAPGNKKIVAVVDLSGNVFGCEDPGPETFTFTKGKGPNQWNEKGFRAVVSSQPLGAVDARYAYKKKTFKGGGTKPQCPNTLDWSWTMDAKFTNNSFTANIVYTLPGQEPFTATANAKKS